MPSAPDHRPSDNPPLRHPIAANSAGAHAPASGGSSPASPAANALEHFRQKTRRLSVHPIELASLWLISTHLVLLPWMLGSSRSWGQWISLALSVIAFVVSLLPRNYTEEHTGSSRFRLLPWPKLLKFPIFWLGLLLFGYIAMQGLNPAWNYRTDGKVWWFVDVPHREGLPSGLEAPFDRWNQWRMILVYGAGWLTTCAIWVAFTRRRTVQLFLTVLAFNGLLLAGFGIAQRLLGNGKIFWFFLSPNPSFFSSFIYKNHGGTYLDLMLAVTCGLAAWYYLRGLRRLEKSNPSGVLAFFATVIAISVLTSYARGATLVMLGFLLVCIVAFAIHQILLPSENRKPIVAIALILIFGYFLKNGMEALQTGEAWDRLKTGVMREDLSLEFREKATAASIEMLGENWKWGVGAGAFRHLFPIYQHRHPDLVSQQGRPMFWEHAHNDIVQFPIELGIFGAGLLVVGGLYYTFALLRSYFWENPLSVCMVLGLLMILGYSWWDFPFQNHAILTTWCALWAVAVQWARFEEVGAKG